MKKGIDETKTMKRKVKSDSREFISFLKREIRKSRKEMKSRSRVKDFARANYNFIYLECLVESLKKFKEIFGGKKK